MKSAIKLAIKKIFLGESHVSSFKRGDQEEGWKRSEGKKDGGIIGKRVELGEEELSNSTTFTTCSRPGRPN